MTYGGQKLVRRRKILATYNESLDTTSAEWRASSTPKRMIVWSLGSNLIYSQDFFHQHSPLILMCVSCEEDRCVTGFGFPV